MKKINIKNSEELGKLLDALAEEIIDAHTYYYLFSALDDVRGIYAKEFSQSKTFWSFTLNALRDASLLHLCRIYDRHPGSLSFPNLLLTIKANLTLFSEANFPKGSEENDFIKHLKSRIPKIDEIEKDINLSTDKDPTVKTLIEWRKGIMAHHNSTISLNKNQFLKNAPFSKEDIESLVTRSLLMFNKYSSPHRLALRPSPVIDFDDHKTMLNLIGLGLKKQEEEISKQLTETS